MAVPDRHALLHVMVIGFHHKKGCQVEYAYPSLEGSITPTRECNGATNGTVGRGSFDMPEEWRRLLPSLALPDGAHHWANDVCLFTLPGIDGCSGTVFGTSCCRQINASELTGDKSEITRNTVQKSICVLTSIPAFGIVEAHLKPVTQAYFEQKDFEQKEILKDLFQQLAGCVTLQIPCAPEPPSALAYLQEETQLFTGLSARDFILRFRHNFLLLVKLVLLERRVLFFGPPSLTPCLTLTGEVILTLLSLLPKMLEDGLPFACETPTAVEDQDLDDDNAFSVKSGMQSLSEDYLVVTRREPGTEETNPKFVADVSDFSLSDSGLDREAPDPSPKVEGPPPLAMAEISSEKDDSGIPTPAFGPPTQRALKGSLKAPRKRVCGGRDRSSSPHMLCGKDIHGIRKDEFLDAAETQSLSSLCVEPPLSVNDNLEDRLDDLSLDEEDIGGIEAMNEDCPVATNAVMNGSEMILDDIPSSSADYFNNTNSIPDNESVKTTDFVLGANDTGEDALLDEIDQIMSASTKGKGRLGLDDDDGEDFASGAVVSPGDQPPMTHSDSKNSILSERSTNIASRASLVKNKLFDVWKGSWGFGDGNRSSEEGASKGDSGSSSSPKSSRRVDVVEDLISQSPSVEHLSIDVVKPSEVVEPEKTKLAQDGFGFPLAVFEAGYSCHPYASLQHLELIQGKGVRGFVLGATNILFKQKSQLSDIVITIENKQHLDIVNGDEMTGHDDLHETLTSSFEVDWRDPDLKRLATLTTADLRFADQIVRMVEAVDDNSIWEGSDEWIRAQVKTYIQSLLVTSVKGDQHQMHEFNGAYIFALQNTHNYKVWRGRGSGPEAWPGLDAVGEPTHPGSSPHLSVNDIKLKVAHTMSSSQSGRKVAAAAATTGKAVVSTGKAVGGAIYSARTSISSWWHGGKRTKMEDGDEVSMNSVESIEG